LHRFLAAGCRVVLGDDDPVTTGSTLGDEERSLIDDGGLTVDQVRTIQQTAVDVAFVDEATRRSLRDRFD
jgi:adenosine deaminase